jgi:sulfopyruvate decarboxylase TPP-binding subunit
MFSGEEIASLLERIGVTHVVTVPDSTIGPWQADIERRGSARVVRVCREGEAWQVAAGLHLGGAVPLVLIQCTGLFESGDAIRNALHDWKLPILSMIGYRSYLNQDNLPGDTSLVFTEPTLDAWRIPYRLITRREQMGEIEDHFRSSLDTCAPGSIVIAEGRS